MLDLREDFCSLVTVELHKFSISIKKQVTYSWAILLLALGRMSTPVGPFFKIFDKL